MVSAENDPRRAGTIWVQDLDGPSPAISPLVAATFSPLGPECAPELVAAAGADHSEEILHQFETGRRCYAARVDAEIAAYGWVSMEEEFIGELNLRLRLLPGEAYIWDCATLPPFRRIHLYSALLTYILSELRNERFCRVWIGANLENIASQRGIDRAGFRRVADVVIARVFTLRQVWVQGHPEAPQALVAEARRVFLNNRDKVWLEAVKL